MIADTLLERIRNILHGDAVTVTANYLAIGDGITPVTGTETKLVNETFRKPITSSTKTGTLDLDIVAELSETDGSLNIKEIGFFANGTSTPNSGILISRILYNGSKTALQTIEFDYTIEMGK